MTSRSLVIFMRDLRIFVIDLTGVGRDFGIIANSSHSLSKITCSWYLSRLRLFTQAVSNSFSLAIWKFYYMIILKYYLGLPLISKIKNSCIF